MKAAPVLRALQGFSAVRQVLIHTGQHYDANMSDVFFAELGMPEPDLNLQVGSGSHAQQTAAIITRFEPTVLEMQPDVVLVYGDVNSTLAAALVCAKLLVPVAHVEAGLRSFDRTMPEEINRLITDQLATFLFTPSQDGNDNLMREGIAPEKIHLVGNVMIDTLVRLLPLAEAAVPASLPGRFALVTLHRPSNVDDSDTLQLILDMLAWLSNQIEVIFPVHPRTRKRMEDLRTDQINAPGLHVVDPLPYLEFLGLQSRAQVVLTDSGGIQEETTFLGIPCLTLRDSTERPITATIGSNVVVGRDMGLVRLELERVLNGSRKKGGIPPLWDGHAGERIANILAANCFPAVTGSGE